jgi:phosphate uptake regulator
MSERSVQLVGGSTYIVSLPKDWAQRHKIGARSKVLVVETPSGSLVISPVLKKPRKIEIDVKDDPELAFKLLTAAYLNGYDHIVITSEEKLSEQTRLAVRKCVRRLMGLEVVRENSTSIEVELAAEPKVVSIENGLKRMSSLVITTLQLGLSPKPSLSVDTLNEMDEDADRLNLMYSRRLRQALVEPAELAKLGLDTAHAFDTLTVFKLLERCVDHSVAAVKIWLNSNHTKTEVERLSQTISSTSEILKHAVDSFISKDAELATNVSKRRVELRNIVFSMLDSQSVYTSETLLMYHLGRIADYAADIAELVLDEGYGFIK